MGQQAKTIQTNFTAGELDPKLFSRIDTKQYYQGAQFLRNVVCLPQGGIKRRPGMATIEDLGSELAAVKFVPFAFSNTQHYMILLQRDGSAPATPSVAYATGDRTATITVTRLGPSASGSVSGGTNSNLVDGGFTANNTDSVATSSPKWQANDYFRFQFATAKYLDRVKLYSDRVPAWETWKVQISSDGSHWTDAGSFTWNQQTQEVNVAGVPVAGTLYLQLLKVGTMATGTGLGTFFEEVEFREGTAGSTAGTKLSIYKGGVFQVDVSMANIAEDQIAEVSFLQSLDTLLIFHPDVQTQKLVRGASDILWTLSDVSFLNIPTDPFSTLTVATVDPAAVTGLNILFTASASQFAAGDVGKVIRGNGGVAVIIAYNTDTTVHADIKKDFLNVNPPIPAGEWTLEEAAWSDTRGWPSCGTFHQGRLYLAGTRQRPQTIWASRAGGQYFDFNDFRSDLADYGFGVVGDSDTVSAMQNLYSGRYLSALADDSEWYFPQGTSDPITPSNVFLKRATRRGSISQDGDGNKRRVPIVEVDGGILFIQKGGKAVRELIWDVGVSDYTAQNIALLSPQLLNSPIDFALRKATSTDESDLAIVTNGDGTQAVLCTLRDQNITAWTGWSTEGEIVACGVDQADIYAVVARDISGSTSWYLEMYDADSLFDASTTITSGMPTSMVASPDFLDGVTVKVRIDGANVADCVPAAGVLTLPSEAQVSVEFGLDFPEIEIQPFGEKEAQTVRTPYVLTMPVALDLQDGPLSGRRKRIVSCLAQFIDTDSASIAGQDCLFRNFDDDTFDTAPPAFTGHHLIEGLLGYDRYGQTAVSQSEPGKFQLASLIRSVAF